MLVNNADKILFRCSSLGHIMTECGITDKQMELIKTLQAKEKLTPNQAKELNELIEKRDNPELPAGVKTHLVDVFVSEAYKRKEEVTSKHLDKGNERENDSITLVSRITKLFFKKNDVRLKNDFIQGEPDLFLGSAIISAEHTRDTKTSWSAHTFFRAKNKPLDPLYRYQGHGYMWLTGAKTHTVDFCLVNGTEKAINDEKRRLAYSMQVIDPNADPEYKKRCRQIEINHIFDLQAFIEEYPHFDFDNDVLDWCYDIPLEQRHHSFTFERDEVIIKKIEQRVKACREWMNTHLFKTACETLSS